MLREIGEYEELSANRDCGWQHDDAEAAAWLDDLARVFDESEQAASEEPDQILAAPGPEEAFAAPAAPNDQDEQRLALVASNVSLPLRFMQLASAAQDIGSWSARSMAGDSLPVRLAVYLKMLGAQDDSYPAEWLDPATGELPTMQQLAALDQVSLPTLRKRRDAAIATLLAEARP
jgi:hypothetical protein